MHIQKRGKYWCLRKNTWDNSKEAAYGNDELPKTARCKNCAHIGTNDMCAYYQKTFTGSDDKAICPRLQPAPPKKQTPEPNTDNKITLF